MHEGAGDDATVIVSAITNSSIRQIVGRNPSDFLLVLAMLTLSVVP